MLLYPLTSYLGVVLGQTRRNLEGCILAWDGDPRSDRRGALTSPSTGLKTADKLRNGFYPIAIFACVPGVDVFVPWPSWKLRAGPHEPISGRRRGLSFFPVRSDGLVEKCRYVVVLTTREKNCIVDFSAVQRSLLSQIVSQRSVVTPV